MDHAGYHHYDRSRPPRYRDESPEVRERFYTTSSDDGAASDSDDAIPRHRRPRSRSPDYATSDGGLESDEEFGIGNGRRMPTYHHENTLYGQRIPVAFYLS